MKKITFLLFTFLSLVFSWQGYAQFDFPSVGPYNVPGGATGVTVNLNDAANTAGVPAGSYSEFILTVDWSDTGVGDLAYSSEAELSIITAAGTTVPQASPQGVDDSNSVTLTFAGTLVGPYDPSVDGALDIQLFQTWSNSEGLWDNIVLTLTQAGAEPDCTTTPFPVDSAVGVEAGDITLTWDAPLSGPTPTSYNLYAYDDALGTNPQLIGSSATTSIDVSVNAFDTTIYWAAVSVNVSTEATGCAIWSFTTGPFSGYCLTAPNGLYPTTTFTASICDGVTPEDITTSAWAGEYSNVDVIAGNTYEFYSSSPDLLTISDENGTTVLGYGVSSVSVDIVSTGVVRVYRSLNDDNCGEEQSTRTISVVCGPTLGVEDNEFIDFSYSPNPVNSTFTIKAQKTIEAVSVYNMLGQEVMKAQPNTVDGILDMSNLSNGSYFVKVTIEGVSEIIRIIKQ